MPIARNPRLKPLRELAEALGAKIKVEYGNTPDMLLVLMKNGEPLVSEYDTYDMLDSIQVYLGGHPNYQEARAQFNYATGEDS